jgi:hypothetical protein
MMRPLPLYFSARYATLRARTTPEGVNMARASVGPLAGGARRIDPVAADVGIEDPLFSGLDGRTIHSGGRPWVMQVVGIHRSPAGVFVQVCSLRDPAGVVLRMAPHATAAHALAALAARFALPPGERPHIIDVMRDDDGRVPPARPTLAEASSRAGWPSRPV